MKKVFISIFLISFIFNFVNAEEVKQTKESNKNQPSKEDDSSKKLLELQERMKKAQQRTQNNQQKEKQIQEETESLNKLEKSINELNKTLGIKK